MQAQITKLAAVATMAIGLALGAVGSAAAMTSVPCFEPLDAGGGAGNARTPVLWLNTDADGTQRYGYMVGQHFVGFLAE
jgi:hypothetical protein